MKTYEGYSQSPDGWNVTSALELGDDGRFSYSEGWTDYTNASLSGGAGGTWRRGEGVIVFRAERVYGPMYFPWAAGQELIARLRDGALDFGRGWTLRPPTPQQEYTIKTPLSNDGTEPLPPPAPPRGAAAETTKPAAKPTTVTPTVKTTLKPPVKPVAKAPAPPFEPRAPSPELAALLRRWVDELSTGGRGNMISRLCTENDAIPLDCTEIYLWALRTDGQVLCIDHESFAQRAEPEENADVAYGKIEVGAKTHPELLELLPPERGGIRRDASSRPDQPAKSVGVRAVTEPLRDSGEYFNRRVAEWAWRNIKSPVKIRPLFSSKAGRVFVYALLFCIPGAFFALGLAALVLGMGDRYTVGGPFFFGLLLLIPCGLIALLGAYVRRGFVKSLDAEGVRGALGQRFQWGKLYYVDHVTKHLRAGRVSRRVEDNQLELVFEGGKVIIPPLIHERAAVWELINRLPSEVRDDGVPRPERAPATGEETNRAGEEFMTFLNSLDGPQGRGK